jgi:hypothetical protein
MGGGGPLIHRTFSVEALRPSKWITVWYVILSDYAFVYTKGLQMGFHSHNSVKYVAIKSFF